MPPLTEADQQTLLAIARRALNERIRGISEVRSFDISPALEQPGGAFVTLHSGSELRGCIGRVDSPDPLHKTVRECAIGAALHDSRFDPVTADEVPALQIEISVLSPSFDAEPEEIRVGEHGIMISRGVCRGLLLPQVATERRWDRFQFLEQTCLKAGLESSAWQHGARVQVFTAQVFGENGAGRPENGG